MDSSLQVLQPYVNNIVDIVCQLTADDTSNEMAQQLSTLTEKTDKSVQNGLSLEVNTSVVTDLSLKDIDTETKYDSGVGLDAIEGDIYCESALPESGDQPNGHNWFSTVLAEKKRLEEMVIELRIENISLRTENDKLIHRLAACERELVSYRLRTDETIDRLNNDSELKTEQSAESFADEQKTEGSAEDTIDEQEPNQTEDKTEERENNLLEEMRSQINELEDRFVAECGRVKTEHLSRMENLEKRLERSEESNQSLEKRFNELIEKLNELEAVREENNKLLNELISYSADTFAVGLKLWSDRLVGIVQPSEGRLS